MSILQDIKEIEHWYRNDDPWGYETNPEDMKRKKILLSELPSREYHSVLDIGCGHGFVTRDLPGRRITGVDISSEAIQQAKRYETERVSFLEGSLFDLPNTLPEKHDLIIVTGLLYSQYIGHALNLAYLVIDRLLMPGGILVSVHIDEWYRARFPYLCLKDTIYSYREYDHKLEIYIK